MRASSAEGSNTTGRHQPTDAGESIPPTSRNATRRRNPNRSASVSRCACQVAASESCGARHRRWIHHTPSAIRSSSAQAPLAQIETISGKASSRFQACAMACVALPSEAIATGAGMSVVEIATSDTLASCHAISSTGASAQASSAKQATA
ncbi:MAG: hypothetical protein QM719_12710 [Thermomonas sp.]